MVFTTPQLLAGLIFVVTYIFIVAGYRERTIAALAGGAALFATGVLTQQEIIGFVNFEALGLLFGMMVIVGVLREAHFFKWTGIHLANLCQCDPKRMLVYFTLATAFLSAFLDNVTTVLFMTVITIEIVDMMKLNPLPFLISQILASNIGGTATLIGDPPNILIASVTGFGFRDFIFVTGPIAFVSTIILTVLMAYMFRKELEQKIDFKRIPVNASEIIGDRRLFYIGPATLIIAVILFFVHDKVGLAPATIAILAAIFLLFVGGPKMKEILEDIEWGTLLFFTALFVVVGGLEKTKLIHVISQELAKAVVGDPLSGLTIVLWFAAIGSAFIDNIPFVAAFIPLLGNLTQANPKALEPLWWALAVGAGFGGNGTAIGASSNVVAIGIAQRMGHKITFLRFLKYGIPTMLLTVATSNLMLLLRARLLA